MIYIFAMAFSVNAKELKVLMIGNSFSNSVNVFLPKLVKAEGKHTLILEQAMIGGCTLERHIKELNGALNDPKFPKKYSNWPIKGRYSLPERIVAKKWDIITIQQASHHSWSKEKTHPYADQLIAYIRKHAPQAEIIIQQTWAYRNSDPRIGGTKPKWGFDQQGMYDRLTDNYTSLAKKYGFRIIPTGMAVQIFRAKTPVKYVPPTAEEIADLTPPNLLSNDGDVVGKCWWSKKTDPKTGKQKFVIDSIHLNKPGEYMQACVWYAFLFGENAKNIKFVPQAVKPEQAALLRTCAQEAIENFKQVK